MIPVLDKRGTVVPNVWNNAWKDTFKSTQAHMSFIAYALDVSPGKRRAIADGYRKLRLNSSQTDIADPADGTEWTAFLILQRSKQQRDIMRDVRPDTSVDAAEREENLHFIREEPLLSYLAGRATGAEEDSPTASPRIRGEFDALREGATKGTSWWSLLSDAEVGRYWKYEYGFFTRPPAPDEARRMLDAIPLVSAQMGRAADKASVYGMEMPKFFQGRDELTRFLMTRFFWELPVGRQQGLLQDLKDVRSGPDTHMDVYRRCRYSGNGHAVVAAYPALTEGQNIGHRLHLLHLLHLLPLESRQGTGLRAERARLGVFLAEVQKRDAVSGPGVGRAGCRVSFLKRKAP